jgi:nucleoside-diphosphate-sugar epimerase
MSLDSTQKFTVLGGTGVIGRRLVASLRAQGYEVYAPSREALTRMLSGTSLGSAHPSLGHVIYAIGMTADFRQYPFETVQAHVSLLSQVLTQSPFESLLYLSSTRVYLGTSAWQGGEDIRLSVRPQDPSDLYNLSKLMGESLCHACARPTVRVARLSNVVGGEDADSSNFIPSLQREARAGRIVLQTALSSAKDYIHIDDVVALLPRIAMEGRHTLYNLASGLQISHGEWAQHLVEQTGCAVEVLPDAPATRFVPIDVTRIRSEFGFEPRSVFSAVAAPTPASAP